MIEPNIEMLELFLRYNNVPGMHTRRMCECGEGSCRRYKCNKCIEKELRILKKDTSHFAKMKSSNVNKANEVEDAK